MTRMIWVYFLCAKFDATETFKNVMDDVRAHGTPSIVQNVRSDRDCESHVDRPIGGLRRHRSMKLELITIIASEMQ